MNISHDLFLYPFMAAMSRMKRTVILCELELGTVIGREGNAKVLKLGVNAETFNAQRS